MSHTHSVPPATAPPAATNPAAHNTKNSPAIVTTFPYRILPSSPADQHVHRSADNPSPPNRSYPDIPNTSPESVPPAARKPAADSPYAPPDQPEYQSDSS